MKILVLGSHGMLGSDLMNAFADTQDVMGWDIEDLDIADPDQCRVRIAGCRPEVIVNAAALTLVDHCESHEADAFRVNAGGPGNLAAAASGARSLLVHYSTDYVFDGTKAGAYVEDDPTCPLNVYGRSKLAGEGMVRARCDNHLIIRTSWLFGRNGANFIRTILNAAQAGRHLQVVDDQRGSPTYTHDLAAHTARLVAAGCRGTYHVTNSGSCTWFELAGFACRCAALTRAEITAITSAEFPRPAARPANSVLANSRLLREGLPLMRHWTEAVAEYVGQLKIDE